MAHLSLSLSPVSSPHSQCQPQLQPQPQQQVCVRGAMAACGLNPRFYCLGRDNKQARHGFPLVKVCAASRHANIQLVASIPSKALAWCICSINTLRLYTLMEPNHPQFVREGTPFSKPIKTTAAWLAWAAALMTASHMSWTAHA